MAKPLFPRIVDGAGECTCCRKENLAIYRLPNGQLVCLICWNVAYENDAAKEDETRL